MDGRLKAVSLIFLFFLLYLSVGVWNYWSFGAVNGGQDFAFHWGRVSGVVFEREYPVGFHLIFSFFGWSQIAFYAANLFLIVVLIPLLLWRISGKWWSVLIYFCGISLPHQLLYGATYPQALLLALFLFYLCFRRNWALLGVLTAVGLLVHHQGLLLFAGVWAAELFWLFWKKFARKRIDKFIHGAGLLVHSRWWGLEGTVELFLIQVPIPVFYFGLKGLKDGFFALLLAGSFLAATQNLRAISVAQLVLVVFSSRAISKCRLRIKAGFVLFLVFQGLFFVADFVGGTLKFASLL